MTIWANNFNKGATLSTVNGIRQCYINTPKATTTQFNHKLGECDWCGQSPKRLYGYGKGHSKVFCNKQCHKDYYA